MKEEQIEAIIRDYIPQIIHLSLATVKDNKPWVCELHFSYDDELNLYFVSSSNSRHAQEIASNPHVAGNIATQHHKNQKVRCVDFEGTAEVLVSGTEAEAAASKSYIDRYGQDLLNRILKDTSIRFFKISVKDFYVFDSYGEARGKHHLPWQAFTKTMNELHTRIEKEKAEA